MYVACIFFLPIIGFCRLPHWPHPPLRLAKRLNDPTGVTQEYVASGMFRANTYSAYCNMSWSARILWPCIGENPREVYYRVYVRQTQYCRLQGGRMSRCIVRTLGKTKNQAKHPPTHVRNRVPMRVWFPTYCGLYTVVNVSPRQPALELPRERRVRWLHTTR